MTADARHHGRRVLSLAPGRIIHSWVEVAFEGRWLNLEGFILDTSYLASLQQRFPSRQQFCVYGAATPDLSAPEVQWRDRDMYIQKDGIADPWRRKVVMPGTAIDLGTCHKLCSC